MTEQVDRREQLLAERYCGSDRDGVAETLDRALWRVAHVAASVDDRYPVEGSDPAWSARIYHHMMSSGSFLPSSPIIMHAGRDAGTLSSCFVLPIGGTIDSLTHAAHEAVQVHSSGGGIGFSLDDVPPEGDRLSSITAPSPGPVRFIHRLSETAGSASAGSPRKSANMALLSITHPDILKFVAAKTEPGLLANFMLSVKVTDGFMARLEATPHAPHVVVHPATGRQYAIPKGVGPGNHALSSLLPGADAAEDVYTVRDVWDLLVRSAWACGEPGVCFIDRVNRGNPVPKLGKLHATNPCGEQPLLAYESCCLGSINLAKFIEPRRQQLKRAELECTVIQAVRFLDSIIDINHYPLGQIREATLATRKIGLGIMGFADALVLAGVRYDSDAAVGFAERVAGIVRRTAHKASSELALTRGCFPSWAGSRWDSGRPRLMRNATCTTMAPTGSISIIAGCSAGIEPIHGLAYGWRAPDGTELVQIHPMLEELGRAEGWMDNGVRAALLAGVPPNEIGSIPSWVAGNLVTAHEVDPEYHVRIQAAFQKHTDSGVAKTVNLPAKATVDDVDRAFRLAFKLGCKGTTVYRDGSREGQPLSVVKPFLAGSATRLGSCGGAPALGCRVGCDAAPAGPDEAEPGRQGPLLGVERASCCAARSLAERTTAPSKHPQCDRCVQRARPCPGVPLMRVDAVSASTLRGRSRR